MCQFQIFSSLFLIITFFIKITYGQSDFPSLQPTSAPTVCVCEKWTGNSSFILDSNKGCKSSVDGYNICEQYCIDNSCECVSEQYDSICRLGTTIAKAISTALDTWIIILIVIASVFGLCILACIMYCICAGALCCAAASKSSSRPIPTQTRTTTTPGHTQTMV